MRDANRRPSAASSELREFLALLDATETYLRVTASTHLPLSSVLAIERRAIRQSEQLLDALGLPVLAVAGTDEATDELLGGAVAPAARVDAPRARVDAPGARVVPLPAVSAATAAVIEVPAPDEPISLSDELVTYDDVELEAGDDPPWIEDDHTDQAALQPAAIVDPSATPAPAPSSGGFDFNSLVSFDEPEPVARAEKKEDRPSWMAEEPKARPVSGRGSGFVTEEPKSTISSLGGNFVSFADDDDEEATQVFGSGFAADVEAATLPLSSAAFAGKLVEESVDDEDTHNGPRPSEVAVAVVASAVAPKSSPPPVAPPPPAAKATPAPAPSRATPAPASPRATPAPAPSRATPAPASPRATPAPAPARPAAGPALRATPAPVPAGLGKPATAASPAKAAPPQDLDTFDLIPELHGEEDLFADDDGDEVTNVKKPAEVAAVISAATSPRVGSTATGSAAAPRVAAAPSARVAPASLPPTGSPGAAPAPRVGGVAGPRVGASATSSARVAEGLYGKSANVPTIRDGGDTPKPRAAAIQLNATAGTSKVVGLEEEEEPIEIGDLGDYGEEEDDDASTGGGFRLDVQEYEDDLEELEEEEEEEDEEVVQQVAAPPPVRMMPVGPTTAEIKALFERARAAAEAGDMQKGADLYSDVLDSDPENMEAHVGRGRLYLDLGDYTRAMSDFMVAEDLAPKNPEPQIAIGDLYFARKDYRKAIEYFDAALAMSPDHAMAFCRRGISHYYRKNYKDSLTDLQRAQQINAEIPNIATYISMAKKKSKGGK